MGRLIDRFARVLFVLGDCESREHPFDESLHLGLLNDAGVQVVPMLRENERHNLVDRLLTLEERQQSDFVDLLDLGLVAQVVLETELGRVELDAEVDGYDFEGVVVGCHLSLREILNSNLL